MHIGHAICVLTRAAHLTASILDLHAPLRATNCTIALLVQNHEFSSSGIHAEH